MIRKLFQSVVTGGDHRLHRDGETFAEPDAPAFFAVIGNGRILMHLFPDTVTDEVADDGLAMSLHIPLNRIGNIA